METYRFDTRISEKGIISLVHATELFNTEVEIIILPKSKKKRKEEKYSTKDFLKEWTGILKDIPEEELKNAKYEYLKKKHQWFF